MAHARRRHPNAPLTPEGRRRTVACVLERGWSVKATAERFQVDAFTDPDQLQSRALPPDPARGTGLHPGPGPQRPNERRASPASSTSTITTDPPARLAGQHSPGTTSPTQHS